MSETKPVGDGNRTGHKAEASNKSGQKSDISKNSKQRAEASNKSGHKSTTAKKSKSAKTPELANRPFRLSQKILLIAGTVVVFIISLILKICSLGWLSAFMVFGVFEAQLILMVRASIIFANCKHKRQCDWWLYAIMLATTILYTFTFVDFGEVGGNTGILIHYLPNASTVLILITLALLALNFFSAILLADDCKYQRIAKWQARAALGQKVEKILGPMPYLGIFTTLTVLEAILVNLAMIISVGFEAVVSPISIALLVMFLIGGAKFIGIRHRRPMDCIMFALLCVAYVVTEFCFVWSFASIGHLSGVIYNFVAVDPQILNAITLTSFVALIVALTLIWQERKSEKEAVLDKLEK